MSAPIARRIRLSDPSELIAAVPHLLGFHPHDSVVLLALHGTRLGLTLRADLVDDEQAPLLAEQLLPPIARQRPTGVALVVIGGDVTPDGDPPHRALVNALDGVLTGAGLPVVHAAWTAQTVRGAPWRCYDDPLCAGTVPDPASSPLAAATVAAAMRCLYVDLDGTLLGPRASLLTGSGGKFSLLGVRALEACARADAEVVIYSGRREQSVEMFGDRSVSDFLRRLVEAERRSVRARGRDFEIVEVGNRETLADRKGLLANVVRRNER